MRPSHCTVPAYRFHEFTLSPRRRLLLRNGEEVPLIPRYFDLLVYLIEHRHEAVHRRDIFDHVWSDVIVSDSALSQAIRTIRRALGDDPRTPRYVRTVSRHGYRFVADSVVEDEEADPLAPWIAALTADETTTASEEERREAAERLHALGTADALRRLGGGPREAEARALLRDARWDVPGAGPVPLVGAPGGTRAIVALVRLRLRRAGRPLAARWLNASLGAGIGGALTGVAGGLVLLWAPGSAASPGLIPVLAAVGLACGTAAGASVAAGLELAEAAVRSWRVPALVLGAAIGGGLVGALTQAMATWTLAGLFGVQLDVGGALEGLAIGSATGAGYALATRALHDGLAAPRGRRRARVVVLTALGAGLAALVLSLAGRPLVGGTLHRLADLSQGAQTSLAPLGRVLGEPGFGPITAALIGTAEGAVFGAGLAWGLTRRGAWARRQQA